MVVAAAEAKRRGELCADVGIVDTLEKQGVQVAAARKPSLTGTEDIQASPASPAAFDRECFGGSWILWPR